MSALSSPSLKALVNAVYTDRRDRVVNPEGDFDKQGRWYPSAREDCGGSGSSTRGPSRAWPYSYLLRCRTRQHVAALVRAWVEGRDVPADVTDQVARRFAGRGADEVRGIARLESVGVRPAGIPTEWLTACGAAVGDAAPVLVLADWLDEHGRGREAARARLAAARASEPAAAV